VNPRARRCREEEGAAVKTQIGWLVVLCGVGLVVATPRVQAQDETVDVDVMDETLAGAMVTDAGQDSGMISVDFKDADIRQVLRIISLKGGVDIVAGPDVEGLVTIKLTGVPWEQALDIILKTYGFTYEQKGTIVRVMTLEAVEQEALETQVFPLNYAKAGEVPDIINEMLSDRGKIKFDDRTNTVIVTDIPSNLRQIAKVIERIDAKTPQVLIATRIVETKLERDENLGLRWEDAFGIEQTQTTVGTNFPFKTGSTLGWLGDNFLASPITEPTAISLGTLTGPDFDFTLNFLRQRDDTRIVSNPTIAVLNNQEARIHIGEEFPVPEFSVDPDTGNTTVSGFQVKEIGTVLVVTPHVNPAKEIVVDLKPEITSSLANQSFQITDSESVELPRFSQQTVESTVRVKDGDTIAIGGLVKEIEVTTEHKIPLLGDLPIFGALFTNTKTFGGSSDPTLKQDLLIFLTVKLMDEDAPQQSIASHAGP